MTKKLLIAYATLSGSTREVAEEIGRVIQTAQPTFEITVADVKNIQSVAPYDAVIIGSAIRVGQWLKPARNFIADHLLGLSKVPVAYFTVCMTLHENTPENRAIVETYTEPIRHMLYPVSEGFFAGAVWPERLSPPTRIIAKAVKVPPGDYRDWDEIDAWANDLLPHLSKPHHEPLI